MPVRRTNSLKSLAIGHRRAALVGGPLSLMMRGRSPFFGELLLEELDQQLARRGRIDEVLGEFARGGFFAEREARSVLASIPGVGPLTIDVLLSAIGDIRRFRSQRGWHREEGTSRKDLLCLCGPSFFLCVLCGK